MYILLREIKILYKLFTKIMRTKEYEIWLSQRLYDGGLQKGN